MQNRPKLRDGNASRVYELYPLGDIPNNIICEIGKWIVYNFAVGKSDISGEDWGDIFNKSSALLIDKKAIDTLKTLSTLYIEVAVATPSTARREP